MGGWRKAGRFGYRLAGLIGLITIGLVLSGFLLQHKLRIILSSVQTTSMHPVFDAGDMLLMKPIAFTGLKRGDIVAFRSPRNPSELVTHRIVAIDTPKQLLTTRGDALASTDPTITAGLVTAKAYAVIPHAGTVVGWLKSWPGLVACIYLPALCVIVTELRRLGTSYRSARYRLLVR